MTAITERLFTNSVPRTAKEKTKQENQLNKDHVTTKLAEMFHNSPVKINLPSLLLSLLRAKTGMIAGYINVKRARSQEIKQ